MTERIPNKLSARPGALMFGKLIIRNSLSSTQDLVRELAQHGAPEGVALMALEQTAGRGRAGHSWVSPAGKNLAFSLLLRPKIDPAEAALLGMMASIAAANTVEACGAAKAELKWPNDVLVNGRKIAGILPEAALNDRAVQYVILGLGLKREFRRGRFPPRIAGFNHLYVLHHRPQTGFGGNGTDPVGGPGAGHP